MVYDLMFDRFPNLRIASIENGAGFLGTFFQKLRSNVRKFPKYFKEDPADAFRRHVWVNPFWEDDLVEAVNLMGPERIIFGSDWPHIEGLEAPRDYLAEVSALDEPHRDRVLFANISELLDSR
jgi:predicted TIM-barrel fold metal-dependent hydrolase